MAAVEQNIAGNCTFHTNQVLFQLGMLIYTQTITEKCQNLLQYVYFCMYEGHRSSRPDFFRNKNCIYNHKLKIYF
mgnify:CR=1 FL=1